MIQMERKRKDRGRAITILCHGEDWVLEGKYGILEGHDSYDHINHGMKLKPSSFVAQGPEKREIGRPDKQ